MIGLDCSTNSSDFALFFYPWYWHRVTLKLADDLENFVCKYFLQKSIQAVTVQSGEWRLVQIVSLDRAKLGDLVLQQVQELNLMRSHVRMRPDKPDEPSPKPFVSSI